MATERLSADVTVNATGAVRGLRETTDASVLAARGVDALNKALEKQRSGAKLTAVELSALGGVVRRFGDDEDKAAVKALAAAASVDRLEKAMADNAKRGGLLGGLL